MKDFSRMTVTIQINPSETQTLCEIVNKIKSNEENNNDEISFGISEQLIIKDIFVKVSEAAKRKANKLEALGAEFRTSLEYGNLN